MLTPLLVLLPIFDPADPAAGNTTASQAGKLGEALAALLPACAAGAAALAGAHWVWRGHGAGRLAIMGAAAALLGLTIFTAGALGRYLLGPAVLLVIPALWLQAEPGPLPPRRPAPQ